MFGLISAVKLFYFLNFTLKGFTPLKKTGFQTINSDGSDLAIWYFFTFYFYKDLRRLKQRGVCFDGILLKN